MDESEQPRKISPDQVEIISPNGESTQHPDAKGQGSPFGGSFGQVKVFRGGPATLLLLPILIPVFLVGFVLLLIAALLFGKTIFKSVLKMKAK